MRRVAAIDIGSNSVRLAVYGVVGSALISLFDEKASCGLGKELALTGCLSAAGKISAIKELRRFSDLADDSNIEALYPFATAAVRDAADRDEFIAQIGAETGLKVDVISGLDEARFAALGVSGAVRGATGIVGDLGGGSLELVRLVNGEVREHATLQIGALMRPIDASPAEMAEWLKGHLTGVGWLSDGAHGDFYLVGGAWRSFARAHMKHTGYPLSVIHEYAIPTDAAIEVADLINMMGERSMALMNSVSRRRRDIMPYAALALSSIAAITKPNAIVASSHGLREGIVRHKVGLAKCVVGDPFLDYCRFAGGTTARITPDGDAIRTWLAPLFASVDAETARWIEGACWLADLAGRDHPDRRADIALARGLHVPAVAISHAGRAFLGTALQARYSGGKAENISAISAQLLTPDQLQTATRLGTILRLAHAVSPSGLSLSRCDVALADQSLTLDGPHALLDGETIARRLKSAALAFDCEPALNTRALAA
jgi:exopolyphosphatase/guanosine-5'-triphosphate,3'-diphosphate pyrophosphatase